MEEVRNASNKLVCRIDKQKRVVEIVIKGCKTIIRFCENGKVTIENTVKKV